TRHCGRVWACPLSAGDQAVPNAGAARRIYARQALARAQRPRGRPQAGDLAPEARRQDRDGLSRLWPANRRSHFRGQRRSDAGGQAFRAGQGLQARDLRHVVDPRLDPGVHPALVVAGQMGTTASQKKLFFNLRKAKSRISALDEGDLRDDQVETISKRLGVAKQDVIDMNRRLGGDASLNAPLREEGEGEWQDWLVDDSVDQEYLLAHREEADNRLLALSQALDVLNPRERRIFEARRLSDDPITLEALSEEFGVSRERVRQIEVRA